MARKKACGSVAKAKRLLRFHNVRKHRSTVARPSKEPTPRRTHTPETRPTTIEGWTLREVVNGTAVIEGPNGVWKVTPGQMVPGVGRVESIVRWGNRLIVATSSGLISTP